MALNASERSISHKVAEHLQREFKNYSVDCEYNRFKKRPKKLEKNLFNNINENDQEAKTIFPDIVIHKRKIQQDNLLVIEIKKSNSRESDEKDKIKLNALVHPNGDFRYEYGLFIKFNIKENEKLRKIYYLEWFQHKI